MGHFSVETSRLPGSVLSGNQQRPALRRRRANPSAHPRSPQSTAQGGKRPLESSLQPSEHQDKRTFAATEDPPGDEGSNAAIGSVRLLQDPSRRMLGEPRPTRPEALPIFPAGWRKMIGAGCRLLR
jgi:hypothetical protein